MALIDDAGKRVRTRREQNKHIRQEALRETLAAGKHVRGVLKMLQQIEAGELPDERLPAYKLVIETKLKLINKYLPDLKSVEVDHGGTVNHAHTHERVSDTFAWIEGILERDGEAEPAPESLPN